MTKWKLYLGAITYSLISCVNSTDSPLPDIQDPVIAVYSPTSNDTVFTGPNEIIYDANDDQGLEHYELFVNGVFKFRVETMPDGSRPQIIWDIDLT